MRRTGHEPRDKRRPTVKDAGRKGGMTARQKLDLEHFEEIGRLGGEKLRNLIEKSSKVEDRP